MESDIWEFLLRPNTQMGLDMCIRYKSDCSKIRLLVLVCIWSSDSITPLDWHILFHAFQWAGGKGYCATAACIMKKCSGTQIFSKESGNMERSVGSSIGCLEQMIWDINVVPLRICGIHHQGTRAHLHMFWVKNQGFCGRENGVQNIPN